MRERGAGEADERDEKRVTEPLAGHDTDERGPEPESTPDERAETWWKPERGEGGASEAETDAGTIEWKPKRGAEMGIEKVSIAVADEYLDRFDEVVRACERAGLTVEQALEGAGVVTGTIESSKRSNLDNVKGIVAVEQQRSIQIPPPESDIQ